MKSLKHLKKMNLALNGPAPPSDMFHCATCGVEVCGKNNWDIHIAGKKHASKKERQAQALNAANKVVH